MSDVSQEECQRVLTLLDQQSKTMLSIQDNCGKEIELMGQISAYKALVDSLNATIADQLKQINEKNVSLTMYQHELDDANAHIAQLVAQLQADNPTPTQGV